ncbi:hypothetical protein BJ170DRAFT_594860 [Xylariales sp. AK1849]|nr:hypothetical protein BJ170DRAFT_594860 [Xylariales sp. AK1849]
MCGDDFRQTQGGALAVLSLSEGSTRKHSAPIMAGRLGFYNKGQGSAVTHVTFSMDESVLNRTEGITYTVGIQCVRSTIVSGEERSTLMEAELNRLLTVGVGGDGIIGRRVTIWTPNAMEPFAEGVVGYN